MLNKHDKFNVRAKGQWNKLFRIICDYNKDIPLKQMTLKAKHEQLVYNQILSNFTRGKPINSERRYLAKLDENMKFVGGPTDKTYARKIQSVDLPDNKRNQFREKRRPGISDQ